MLGWSQYEILGVLGSGKYGLVSRARHKKLGCIVALKSTTDLNELSAVEVSSDCKKRASLYHEAQILAKLNHPALVSLIELCVGTNGELVIAMEDLGGTSLTNLIENNNGVGLCSRLVGCILGQIGSALEYMHSSGYLHRDVKSDNIMVENNDSCFSNAKLIDFGLSISFSEAAPVDTSVTRAGTLINMAPELMHQQVQYGPEIDVFSLGTVIFHALTGYEPFISFTTPGGQRKTTSIYGLQVHHEDEINELHPNVQKVLFSMLEKDVSKRCSISTVLDNPWVLTSCQRGKYVQNYVSQLQCLDNWLSLDCQDFTLPNKCFFCSLSSEPQISLYDDSSEESDSLNLMSNSFVVPETDDGNEVLISKCKLVDRFCKLLGFTGETCSNISACVCSEDLFLDSSIVANVAKVLEEDESIIHTSITKKPWGVEGGVYNLLKIDNKSKFKSVINSLECKFILDLNKDLKTKTL